MKSFFRSRVRITLFIITCLALVVVASSYATREKLGEQLGLSKSVTVTSEELHSLSAHTHSAKDAVSDEHHGVEISAPLFVVPEDMWVNDLQLTMHGAPKATLHHLNLYAAASTTEGSTQYEVVSFGQDTNSHMRFPDPYAIFLKAGTVLTLSGMLHNPQPPKGPGGNYENVSVSVTLSGPTFFLREPQQVFRRRLILSDGPNAKKGVFVVPAHTESYVKTSSNDSLYETQFTFTKPATIITVGGHTHPWEGGRDIDMYLNGKKIVSLVSRRNGIHPWDWYTPRYFIPISVSAGDTVTMSATYTNDENEPLQGAMGMLSFCYVLADTTP